MNSVFADTWFYLATLNPADPNHARAVALARAELARTGNRDVFTAFYKWIRNDSGTTVVPATRLLLEDGVQFYRFRRDKDWPLTDCISFVVMEDEGIRAALTGDRHFEQAGFTALLK